MTTQLFWFGREVNPGEVVDLPEDVAKRYLATQQAEPVEQAATTPVVREAATVDRSAPNAAYIRKPNLRK